MVTGANSGIGLATATELARQGAIVTITTRSPVKGDEAVHRIKQHAGADVASVLLDLSDRTSVETCAAGLLEAMPHIDVLINNAGAILGSRRVTSDGWELTLATNHLGPFLLTQLLMPGLEASGEARVINVASSGHGYAKEGFDFDDPHAHRGYRMMRSYGQSKLANILHASELDRRYGDRGIHAFSMHPGLVSTSIGRGGDAWLADLVWRITRRRQVTPEEGADTVVWLATDPDPEPRGGYFEQRSEARSSRHARDADQARRLWEWSMAELGIEGMS